MATSSLLPATSRTAALAADEAIRLQVLRGYGVFDTESERELDDLTRLAAQICDVPVALVSFIAEDRQWLRSAVGLDATGTCREGAFCAHEPRELSEPQLTALEALSRLTSALLERGREAALTPRMTCVTGLDDGRFKRVGSAWERILGYPADELVGCELLSFVHPDDHDRTLREMRGVRPGRTVEFESRFRASDGSFRWLMWDAAVSPGERLVYSGARDIAGRKEGQLALARSEALKTAMLESSLDCVLLLDAEGLVQEFNPAAERTFGHTRAEVVGRPLTERVFPCELPRGQELVRELVGGGSGSLGKRVEAPAIHADGTRFPIELTVTRAEAGEPFHTVFIRDITKRKRAEQEIAASEAKYRLLAENGTDLVSRHSPDGRYLYASRASRALLGWEPHELVGRSPYDTIHPDDVATVTLQHRAVLKGPDVATATCRALRRDGEYVWVETTMHSVRDGDGEIVELQCATRDIGERVAAQALVRSAREEAERANEAKSEFLSRMSHELRTPLNAILGFAQLLEVGALDEDQLDSVGHVLNGGRHLLELINEVLEFSRVEAGHLAISAELVSVSPLFAEVIDMLRPIAGARSIRVRAATPATPEWRVVADRQRLRQVLLNLVANAIKYSPESVEVILRADATAHEQVRITVTDAGPGIREEDQPRLFQPFERLGAEHTGVEGTGLGLALCRRLVTAMGGAIGVESRPGEGSRFWVELPLERDPIEGHVAPRAR